MWTAPGCGRCMSVDGAWVWTVPKRTPSDNTNNNGTFADQEKWGINPIEKTLNHQLPTIF